ncbi:MAG: hypothetical protein ACE149_19880 [Armatimonadota bacterium]
MRTAIGGMLIAICLAATFLLAGCRSEDLAIFRPGVAYATTVGGTDPLISLSADRTSVAKGETVKLTSVVSVPTIETQNAKQVSWRYQLPSGFSLVEATGPRPISNQATLTWSNPDGSQGSATSNVVTIVVVGASLSLTPDANRYISIPCGDIKPGEERTITLSLRYDGE